MILYELDQNFASLFGAIDVRIRPEQMGWLALVHLDPCDIHFSVSKINLCGIC